MNKLNRKGFMMAEVIVVAAIVLTTLVGLYSIFTKMYIVYTERSYYYNGDAVYALKTIYERLIKEQKMSSLINEIHPGLTETNIPYIEFINLDSVDSINCNGYINEDICKGLYDTYSIERVILARYDENVFTNVSVSDEGGSNVVNVENNLISNYSKENIGSYLGYLSNLLDFDDDFSYIFIIELKDGEYHYYGNYRIR